MNIDQIDVPRALSNAFLKDSKALINQRQNMTILDFLFGQHALRHAMS